MACGKYCYSCFKKDEHVNHIIFDKICCCETNKVLKYCTICMKGYCEFCNEEGHLDIFSNYHHSYSTFQIYCCKYQYFNYKIYVLMS